jgi:hypothetical protein
MQLSTRTTPTFKIYFENVTSGALGGSPGGFDPSGNISGSDFYEPGDTRIPQGSGVLSRKGLVKTRKTRKRRKRRKTRRKRKN